MNDNSATNRAESRMPSDDQTDALLRDFFRLEVPTELSQPLRRNQLTTSTVATSTVATLTVAPDLRVEQPRPRSVRFVAVTASVAAMALAVLVVISGNNAPSSHVSDGADGGTESPNPTPKIDKPMLVSPEGDSRKATKAVGPDGVTLEETDIELHPQE
ncbi:MAG: hypothetical protein H7Z17_15790 [Fuerstia sp.]|nr:hypothetical protein [Fuerstiella sp.]